MKNLSKKQIVAICDNVIKRVNNSNTPQYLDVCILTEIQNITKLERYEIDIKKYIPQFTLNNAVMVANAEPDCIDGTLWFNTNKEADKVNRITFMEWIKSQYQNK